MEKDFEENCEASYGQRIDNLQKNIYGQMEYFVRTINECANRVCPVAGTCQKAILDPSGTLEEENLKCR